MQDIWEVGNNIAFGQGLFTLTTMAKQHEWEKVQMVRWACWSHSLPLILTTSVKYVKLPAMYNCVKCVYICNCDCMFNVLMGV